MSQANDILPETSDFDEAEALLATSLPGFADPTAFSSISVAKRSHDVHQRGRRVAQAVGLLISHRSAHILRRPSILRAWRSGSAFTFAAPRRPAARAISISAA